MLSQNNHPPFDLRYFFQKWWSEHNFFTERCQMLWVSYPKPIWNHSGHFRPSPAEFEFFPDQKKHFFSGLPMLSTIPIVERRFEIFGFNQLTGQFRHFKTMVWSFWSWTMAQTPLQNGGHFMKENGAQIYPGGGKNPWVKLTRFQSCLEWGSRREWLPTS